MGGFPQVPLEILYIPFENLQNKTLFSCNCKKKGVFFFSIQNVLKSIMCHLESTSKFDVLQPLDKINYPINQLMLNDTASLKAH